MSLDFMGYIWSLQNILHLFSFLSATSYKCKMGSESIILKALALQEANPDSTLSTVYDPPVFSPTGMISEPKEKHNP